MSTILKYSSLALLSTLITACSGGSGSAPVDNESKNDIKKQDEKVQAPVYHLSVQPLHLPNQNHTQNDELLYKQEIEKLLVNGTQFLLLSTGQVKGVESITGQSTDDVGLHLVKNNISNVLSGLGKIRELNSYKEGVGSVLLLRDPETNGWKHQSFGRYSGTSNGRIGYISFGEQSQNLPTSGEITYQGIAWGDAKEKQNSDFTPVNSVSGELAATLELKANFSNKTLEFKTKDTKGYQLNGGVQDYAKFDLTGNASWNSGEKAFTGTVKTTDNATGTLKGSFYGPNAIEVGGTFGIKADSIIYQGGFGGKQVQSAEKADNAKPASR